MKTVLLHTCCGPCGFSATKFLNGEFNIKYYWYNPNIQPPEEYEKRMNVAQKLFSLITDDYDNKLWIQKVGEANKINLRNEGFQALVNGANLHNNVAHPLGWVSEANDKRCVECYRIRLMKTAQKSKELNADFFSTTLLISPYQQHSILKKMGEDIARQFGANFYYYDGRPDFYKNLNEFRKSGLYTQKYCGCLFSKNKK
ncbi:MAG: hypothetical protein COS68_06980 [Elusimicrobia bacterium CG06_land_8_20_14_3_00_38_11]|nr:MAG: hypothetical protein COS68_06980 [Elusimicrobia bacterium CG06_land_8_20_14_3_00_38_11]